MAIRLYNTLTKNKEPLETVVPGKIGMYLCGPTVYDRSHIGHMVGPVIFDSLKRFLTFSGYHVTWVVNITDVDDKLIKKANERGISMSQVADENIVDYLQNLKSLGVTQIDVMPKATEHMAGIIKFTQQLIERGFAYAAGGDVFFDVAKDPGYGKLSNRSADEQLGEGGDAASKKKSSGDFALWKAAKPGEPFWESPWGQGRPGWHIECSAMSRSTLGETFDIHGGGLDLLFPHHENERAQSECCHGKPMVRYWMHNGLMRADTSAGKVGGRGEREANEQATVDDKISRSKGAGGLADLIKRQGGERIRFFLLRTHYRSTIVFSEAGIEEAGTGLEGFHRWFERYERITGKSFYLLRANSTRVAGEFEPGPDSTLKAIHDARNSFLSKMDDDFNTGGAVSDLFELLRVLNRFVDEKGLEEAAKRTPSDLAILDRGASVLRDLSMILGLFLEKPTKSSSEDDAIVGKLMQLVIELRADARVRKDFPTADKIRTSLTAMGITLEDRKDGTLWRIG